MLSNAIENAQKQVESRNFQTRKNVLQYDDVMNTQREVIYKQRRQVLDGEDLQQSIQSMLRSTIENAIRGHMGEQKHMTAEEFREATALFHTMFLLPDELRLTDEELQGYTADGLVDLVMEKAQAVYQRKEQEFTPPLMRELERVIMLRVVDEYWMDQIDAMTDLKQGIGLRAYAQTDPVVAYKKEGYEMFEQMIAAIQEETLRRLFLVRIQRKAPDAPAPEIKRERVAKITRVRRQRRHGQKAAGKKGGQDRPQRPLPLRQRAEVEEVYLQGVSQRAAVRTHTKAVDPYLEQGGIGAQLMPPCCVPAFDDQEEKESTDGTDRSDPQGPLWPQYNFGSRDVQGAEHGAEFGGK